MNSVKKMCFIVSYYDMKYVRSKTLLLALEKLPVNVCTAMNTNSFVLVRYFQTLFKVLKCRIKYNPETYILGFRGHEIFWPVRIITLGKTLIFDQMMSPYMSLVDEKKLVRKGTIFERILFFVEKSILLSSQSIITDTRLNKEAFVHTFKIKNKSIFNIHVGADETLFYPRSISNNKRQNIHALYYGSFLPLHGIDIILEAAKILKNDNIRITLIGGKKQDVEYIKRFIHKYCVSNIEHKLWVDLDKLPMLIRDTDVGLTGPFGNTPQSSRVITGKTFQFLASAKASIVGTISEDYGFRDRENCLLVEQGNSIALADSLKWCIDNKDELVRIGSKGYVLYDKNFSIENHIKPHLEKLLL